MTDAMMHGTLHPEIGLKGAGQNNQEARLRKACSDFESIFLHYILKSARNTLPESKLFDNSHESRLYESMMDEKMAISMARGNGTGLGRILYEDLSGIGQASSKNADLSGSNFDPIQKDIGPSQRKTGEVNGQTARNYHRLALR